MFYKFGMVEISLTGREIVGEAIKFLCNAPSSSPTLGWMVMSASRRAWLASAR